MTMEIVNVNLDAARNDIYDEVINLVAHRFKGGIKGA